VARRYLAVGSDRRVRHRAGGFHELGRDRVPGRARAGRVAAAICMGREAHEDPARRFMAAVFAGVAAMSILRAWPKVG
jgi:hypothetical protein